MRQEGENGESSRGSIPISIPYSVEKEDEDEGEKEEKRGVRPTTQGELLTYSRRENEPEVPTVTVPVPSPSSNSDPTPEIPTQPSTIDHFVSYSHISPSHGAFIASLDSVIIPNSWQDAKKDPKWKAAMHEELGALEKNHTWELATLPAEKRVVGCNGEDEYCSNADFSGNKWWMGTTPTGCEECVSSTNGGWELHQLDVKNAFLHGDLVKEVYMEIPPGCGCEECVSSWRSSERGVQESHGDDEKEIAQLKVRLSREFEVKDLGQLRYFLGIEIAHGPKGIVLSQRKYALDLHAETGMLGCKPAATPIDHSFKLSTEAGEPVDRERYHRLVGRLIYLSHTRPDISFAVSVVSRYMHDPRKGHMDAVYQILRYLKGSPGKELRFKRSGHVNIKGYCDSDWASCGDDRRSTSGYCIFVGGNLVS
ncbi:uncharacterized protein LOC109846618 [Asparagus officinalis]|uniref:uncharacterized protein LOC109846618 n=1 Tax=Asparagus officinalis TaxID=4686 RepID=UPI00098E3028|nr:uncharacterized protein LOC109846618 [Asparagus officinalis]